MNKSRNWKRYGIQITLISLFIAITCLNAVYSDSNSSNSSSNSSNMTINIADFDMDGFNYTTDCDDTNATINPNATETPYDGIDQDCDGSDLTDVDMDGFNYTTDCDDTNATINPNSSEVFFNGVDDDCDIATSDEIIFSITTSKNNYNIDEEAAFTVHATNNSDVSISVIPPNNYFNYQAQFINQTYPITDNIPSTRKSGEYLIIGSLTYHGYVMSVNKTFNVINSIGISIEGETGIDEDETLHLNATASGGHGSNYLYSWHLGDGSTKTGQKISHDYSSPGEYDVKISVKDEADNVKNKTISVKVNRLYELEIKVVDKAKETPIKGALISIDDDDDESTSNLGVAKFIVRRGDYDITVYKQGYKIYDLSSYSLKKNSTLDIQLSKVDEEAPVITIENEKITATQGSAKIGFSISDASSVDCSIYTSDDGNWWNLEATIEEIIDSKKREVDISDIEADTKFRLECEDTESNTALSREGTIKPETQASTSSGEIEKINTDLENAERLYAGLRGNEKEIYTLLEYDVLLKDAQRKVRSLNSDIENIIFARCPGLHCNITDNEKQDRINGLIAKSKTSVGLTATSITLANTEEFVKYPSKLELESTLKKYFESKNEVLTKKEMKSLIEKTSLLQSKLTVSTKVYNIKAENVKGDKKTLTVVKKELEILDYDGIIKNKDYILVEDVDINGKSNININFLTDTEEISNENLYSTDPKTKTILYTIEGDVDDEILKSSKTVLISKVKSASSGLTGFAFKDIIKLEDINYVYLMVILVAIIIIARFSLMFGLFDKLGIPKLNLKIFSRFNQKEFHQIMMLVNDAQDYLDANDVQKASLVYKEIKLKYEEISKTNRQKVYDKIIEMGKRLDEEYMKNLIRKAMMNIQNRDISKSRKIYSKIQMLYKKLAEKSKALFEKDLLDIHRSLARGESQ